MIAEIAANQGLDLYGLTVDGKSLHSAVRFLLDAVDDQERVAGYAWADETTPVGHHPSQDLGFLVRRGHGRHYMAWVEIYLARFPERPESRRLLALLAGPSRLSGRCWTNIPAATPPACSPAPI